MQRGTLQVAAERLGVPLALLGGCDDESSAYRWAPVLEDHLRSNVVAYYNHRARKRPSSLSLKAISLGSPRAF